MNAPASPASPASPSRVAELFAALADGVLPPADGVVEVVPQPPGPVAGILAFTGHHVVAADVDPDWVHAQLAPWDMSAPVGPAFVGALQQRLGVQADNLDVTLLGRGTGIGVETGTAPLVPVDLDGSHPRVERSLRYRTELRAWTTQDGAGLLLVGRGLAGRWEAAFEVDEEAQGHGLGRRLAAAAAHAVPEGEPIVLAVAPGNARSLRAVLATGRYLPVGGEILFPVG